MKNYRNIEECIHAYANKKSKNGKCGNVFFENGKLYSYGYHFILAEFLSENVVLLNGNSYSASTNRHQSITRYATRHLTTLLGSRVDIDICLNEAKECLEKLAKARKPQLYTSHLTEILRSFNHSQSVLREIGEKSLIERKNSKKYNLLRRLCDVGNLGEKVAKAVKAAKAAKVKKAQAFLRGEIRTAYGLDYDLARISKDGKFLETSQGLKIPLDKAKALFRAFQQGKEVIGLSINGFTILKANNNICQVGCHKFKTKNLKRQLS